MGKRSGRIALLIIPAAFCLLLFVFWPRSFGISPMTVGIIRDGGDDGSFRPAPQAAVFSWKSGHKNGLYIKEEEAAEDSLTPLEGGDGPLFCAALLPTGFVGKERSFCVLLCTALLQMGSALYLIFILHKADGKKRGFS